MADGCTTNKRDFEIFKKECAAWQKKLGLLDWQVEYHHEEDDVDYRACCSADYSGRCAVISLAKEWDRKPTTWDIKKNAFHEMCELMITNLAIMARSRWGFTMEDVEAAEHILIRTLENVLFKPLT